jgi:hypothetical protein
MQRYRCYKIVEAAPIAAVVQSRRLGKGFAVREPHEVVEVPAGFASRGAPAEGDYLVRYEDGYLSWSPKAVFETGYAPIGDNE